MERINQIDEEIKKIKSFYEVKKEEVRAKQSCIREKRNALRQSVEIIFQQIHELNSDLAQLNREFESLIHDCKVSTLPLRTEKHRYMENLRKEIRQYKDQ